MIREFEHGGNIYEPAPDGEAWLDFSANINPLGLPSSVRNVLAREWGQVIHYPDPQGRELKTAIGTFYQVPTGNVILGNGAAELLYLFFHALRPRTVLLPVPSFNEYERAALAGNAGVKYFFMTATTAFDLDVLRLLPAMEGADCLVLGNPNNPTGNLLDREKVETIVAHAAKKNMTVIVDESFLDFRRDRESYTAFPLIRQYDNLFIIQSLTKFYALPGLRLGFGIGNQTILSLLEKHKDVWNVNVLAQKAGAAALADSGYQSLSRSFVESAGDHFVSLLQKIPHLHIYPRTVNFLFFAWMTDAINAEMLSLHMKKNHILIRDCSNYPALDSTFFRIAVRKKEENIRLFEKLKDYINSF